MKKYRGFSLLIFIVVMVSACFLGDTWSNLSPGGTATLPPDQIYDTPRSFTGPFEFDTLLGVELELNVVPHESTTEAANIIITLHDEQGNLVYTGKIQSGGSFSTLLQLPAAPEDMTLTLIADGFESREVIISDMVSYSKIDRHMSILSKPLEARSIFLIDSDGDSIPDIYDAFPNDPDRAFSNATPSLTVAFEDLFLRAQAGDADYNDFIAKYSITEILNSDNHIVEIQGEVEAVAKMAGYNHLFGIMIDDLPEGTILNVDYIDSSGNSQNSEATINGLADIVLFESTKNAVGMNAGFSIIFDSEAAEDRSELVQVPYNPYLLVFNTGHDIHLIGEDALPGSINPGDNYQDSDGFPWALLVPTDWIHPDESQRIEVHYPRFTLWRESFGAEHSDWYLHYDDPYEPPVEPDPDYPEMVFTSDRGDGDLEIWVWDTDTGFSQLTFNDSIDDKQPALSADRSKIAYVSGSGASWGIYTMNSDGTGVSSALTTLVGLSAGNPSWSPDGTMIAYDSDFDIFTMNSNGSNQLNRTGTSFHTEIEPSWSPSGTQIAFSYEPAGSGEDYEIYTLDPDIAVTVPVTIQLTDNTTTNDNSPSWSGDGSEIVFSTNRDGDFDIYTMASDGSAQTAFVSTAGDETSPSWSADGAGIAYVKGGEIYTRNSDGSGIETNITNNAATDQDPSW